MTALERVQRARTALVLDHPFFGVLALRLHLVEDATRPTAWTDGASMGFNPPFVAQLSADELKGVIAHEVMHCASGHPWRRGEREPLRWNLACDYAINHILLDSGLTLPSGCLRDKAFNGKWAEWIYDRIQVEQITIGFGSGGDDVRDGSEQGQAQGIAAEGVSEAEWQQAVQQVAQAEKTRGTLPQNIARLVGLLGQPRVDWRSVLRRFIQEATRADYQWTRPNARMLAHGLYMPGLRSEAMGPMAVAIDTSGSIDRVLLNQFASELNAIADDVQPERVHVAYCDEAIQGEDVFERGEPIELQPRGGGGTDFAPVMDWVSQLDETPVCLVYLTDLYGSHGQQPEMPVLWACPNQIPSGYPVPFGEVVALS